MVVIDANVKAYKTTRLMQTTRMAVDLLVVLAYEQENELIG